MARGLTYYSKLRRRPRRRRHTPIDFPDSYITPPPLPPRPRQYRKLPPIPQEEELSGIPLLFDELKKKVKPIEAESDIDSEVLDMAKAQAIAREEKKRKKIQEDAKIAAAAAKITAENLAEGLKTTSTIADAINEYFKKPKKPTSAIHDANPGKLNISDYDEIAKLFASKKGGKAFKRSRKGSKYMKEKMAYVRSFRKKK